MTRRTRIALAATATLVATVGSAAAAPTAPGLKDGPAFADGASITAAWTPSTFGTNAIERQYEVRIQDVTVGAAPVVVDAIPGDETSYTFTGLENGHRYRIWVRAFERACTLIIPPGPCIVHAATPTYSTSSGREFRIDRTAPTGSMTVNGGAAYATSRDVALTLSATDPLSAGQLPSGIGGVQISEDAAFSCNVLGSIAECPVPVVSPRPYTLSEGPDGVRTVRVRYRDKAQTYNQGGGFAIPLGPTGNASPTYSDTIILDRSQPTPVVTMGVPTADAGVPVAFSASSSTDATSGVNTASAVWDFGDGTAPVNALQLNKSFAAPGTYNGTLTISDKAGNANTQAFSFVVTGAPAPGGGGVTVTDPGTPPASTPTATPVLDPIRGAKRLNRAVQGKVLRIRVRLAGRVPVRVSILRVSSSGKAVVRRKTRVGGPGFVVFTFRAPKAGRHVVRVTAGADSLSFPMGIAKR